MHIHDIDVKDFDLVQVQGDVRVTAQVPNGRFVAKEIHTTNDTYCQAYSRH